MITLCERVVIIFDVSFIVLGTCHYVQLLLCCFIRTRSTTEIRRHQEKHHTHSDGNFVHRLQPNGNVIISLNFVCFSLFFYFQVQFTIILIQCALTLARGCEVPKLLMGIYVPNILLIFYMFYEFFNKAYKKKAN